MTVLVTKLTQTWRQSLSLSGPRLSLSGPSFLSLREAENKARKRVWHLQLSLSFKLQCNFYNLLDSYACYWAITCFVNPCMQKTTRKGESARWWGLGIWERGSLMSHPLRMVVSLTVTWPGMPREKAKSLDHFPDDLQSDVDKFFSKKSNALKRNSMWEKVIAKLYMHNMYTCGNAVYHSERSVWSKDICKAKA